MLGNGPGLVHCFDQQYNQPVGFSFQSQRRNGHTALENQTPHPNGIASISDRTAEREVGPQISPSIQPKKQYPKESSAQETR
jgi:hypothetical protein